MQEILVRVLKWEVELSTHCSSIRDMSRQTAALAFRSRWSAASRSWARSLPSGPNSGSASWRELALTRSTTHRYVATLATLGYLDQDEATRKYRLGLRVLDLGFAVLGSLELREIAAPHLRRLTETTGHTANLAVRDDTDVILIDRVSGRPCRYHHFEFSLHIGSRLPPYCSATGKTLLAFLPRQDLDRLLDTIDLTQRGPRTLTDRTALLAELEQVRRTGIAVNDEELDNGLRSIAAPVRSRSGSVVAAVNLAIPWSPVAMSELVDLLGPAVQGAARQISARVI